MKEGQGNTQASTSSYAMENKNVFSLKKVTQSGVTAGIQVDFSAVKATPNSDSPCPLLSNLPIFNRDKRHYTPCFILPTDQTKFESNIEMCLVNHLRKIKQMSEEKNQILIPKPSETNRFCMVCKAQFDDYLTHISHSSHRDKLKSSIFYNDILDLCKSKTPIRAPRRSKNIVKARVKKEKAKIKGRKENGRIQQSTSTGMPLEAQILIGC